MTTFVVEIKNFEVSEGVEFPRLIVTGTYAYLPEKRRGHPDTWAPEEFEFEVSAVSDYWGRALPLSVVEHMKDDERFLDAVGEAVLEQRHTA